MDTTTNPTPAPMPADATPATPATPVETTAPAAPTTEAPAAQ